MLPGDRRDLDPFVFIATAVFVAVVSIPMLLAPDQGERTIDAIFSFLTQRLGFVYVWAAIANLAFVCWIGFGRYGRVRLSRGGEGPEFSTFSWVAMLFCAGMGTGILYWGTIEWAYYFDRPPFGAAPGSTEAIEWATAYPVFHWGITGWALYCLPTLAIAYGYFVRGLPSLRLSASCRPLIGAAADGWLGRMIDLIFMVGLLGAAGTGIGLAVPLISTAMSRLFGIEVSFALNVAVILAVTALFSASVWYGLERGIQRLSRWNVILTLLLLAFVLIVGPTVFILDTGTNAVGHMLQNFIKMNFWTDPIDETGFVESWTIFYWAWWIALAPFMGMFVARISKGRTLREVVFGMIGIGPAGCIVFFTILGNYALKLELDGALEVSQLLRTHDAPHAITSVILSLPAGTLVLALFCIVSLVFMATTYDSAAYTLALGATRRLAIDAHPPRWHRVFWALVVGVIPLALMYLGGLKVFQTASIAVSLPLVAVGVLLAGALVRSLRSGPPHAAGSTGQGQ